MIFSRNRKKQPTMWSGAPKQPITGASSEDDVMDIARTMVPQEPKPQILDKGGVDIRPPAPGSATAAPKYFAYGDREFDFSGSGKGAAARDRIANPPVDATTLGDRIRDSRIGKGAAAQDRIENPPPKSNEDLIDDIVRQLLEPIDNTAARGAADEALQQRTAESRANARARMGMAGMGLSGAAAAAEGTEGRRGERERILTMDEFDRNARSEQIGRFLEGIGASRESEVFKRIMEQLDKENEPAPGELPDPDTDGNGVLSQAEIDAARTASEQQNTTENQRRTLEIEAMSDSEFESMNNKELERLGWTVEGPMGDGPSSPLYFLWTSPEGIQKRAYIDSGDPAEWLSSGLEWG